MARSPSDAGIPPSAAPQVPQDSRDVPPAVPPGAPRRAGRARLRGKAAAALGLFALAGAFAACVIPELPGAGHPRAGNMAGAVLSLLAAALLAGPLRRSRAADTAGPERQAAAWQANAEEAARQAAEATRRAEDARQQAENLIRQARDRQDSYQELISGFEAAVSYLTGVQLPAVLEGSPPQEPPPGPAAGSSTAAALSSRVTDAVASAVAALQDRSSRRAESGRLAMISLARKVQASAHRIQAEATRLENLHQADPGVVEASMRVDHSAAQQSRIAQSVLVLCGEWPGQQWPAMALQDVVRSAAGRIAAYKRVQVLGDTGIAAVASVAEPLIHLVAELLANAAQCSPPATAVQVAVKAVPNGAVIEVVDAGVGMRQHDLEQAQAIVSGRTRIGLDDLGEVPRTGLAVIGEYVRRHELRVTLSESAYGGIRAVVLVPSGLTEQLKQELPSPPAVRTSGPQPPGPARPAGAAPAGEHGLQARSAAPRPGMLPQRQSRRGSAPQDAPGTPAPATAPRAPQHAPERPEQAGLFLASFISTAPDAGAQDPTDTER